VIAILITVHYLRPAPPTTVTITSGPDDSVFCRTADKYQKILARNGVTLRVVPFEGPQEDLKRLLAPNSRVDVGFVQGGLAGDIETDGLSAWLPRYLRQLARPSYRLTTLGRVQIL
jgi:hypothetical protein